jgi:uncharacterized protein (DUF1330 family)
MNAPRELNEAFVRGLLDNGPVVMLNLVRLRERSADGNGTGWDAYLRYSRETMPLIKGVGGTVLWAGDAEGFAFGDVPGGCWNYVVLVRYPSRGAFLAMVTSEPYARANLHRDNGVADHVIIATRQTYAK